MLKTEWTTNLFVGSYALLLTGTALFAQWYAFTCLIAIALIVVIGEVICFNRTGELISDKFQKQSRIAKIVLVGLLWVFIISLSIHFLR